MPSIIVGMKADQVTVQNTEKEGLSHGENPIYLAAGEWCMQEEANFDILLGRANLLS